MLAQPSQFGAGAALEGQFWATFWPAITANVGFWATISLNIPDFTRWALPGGSCRLALPLQPPPPLHFTSLLRLLVASHAGPLPGCE